MPQPQADTFEKPDLKRGDIVTVIEEGIEPWSGIVLSLKPSKVGWWVEVNTELGAWSICVENGTKIRKDGD